jgi:zinc/manganese transport system substrate-binding protein
MKTLFATLFFVILLLSGGALRAEEPMKIIASFSILADIVKQVGGDKVVVATLVGPNSDAHAFVPRPSDAKALNVAKLVVVNGLGLEGWMDRLVKESATEATVVVASKGIQTRSFGENDALDAKDLNHVDPHAWQSIPNVMVYVNNIRDALIAADKANENYYTDQAERYVAELRTLDAWVRAQIGQVPAELRRIITNHEAFGYFGREYEVSIIAAQGIQAESQPSAARIAQLVKQMKSNGVKAVFIENVSSPRLMQSLQKLAPGTVFGGALYSDALSDKSPADTYAGVMRWNTTAIADGMRRAIAPEADTPASGEAEKVTTPKK